MLPLRRTSQSRPDRQAPRRDQAHHAQEEAPFVCFSDLHEIDEDDGYFTPIGSKVALRTTSPTNDNFGTRRCRL